MTPKQIANHLALISLANLDDPEQAAAALSMLKRTMPHFIEATIGPVEIASTATPAIILSSYTTAILATLFPEHAAEDEDVSDEDIAADAVADEEETDPDQEVLMAGMELPLLDSIAALKELAEQQTVRDKGKYLPLQDGIVVKDNVGDDEDEPLEEIPTKIGAKPRSAKPAKEMQKASTAKGEQPKRRQSRM